MRLTNSQTGWLGFYLFTLPAMAIWYAMPTILGLAIATAALLVFPILGVMVSFALMVGLGCIE